LKGKVAGLTPTLISERCRMPRDDMGETVFFGYDQAALDREYNNSGKVANVADYLAWYPGESARARETRPARLDLRYGPRPGETLDLFLPEGHGPWPVHVFVHGGYWRSLDKQDFSFVARAFQPAGVLVAVVNYALVPTVDMDELVRQVRASVAWLHRNVAALGGDPARLTVSGHSAGGHLVAMLMSTDWSRFADLPPDVVKAGCGISGLYDLEPIRLCYLNATLGLTMEAARRNSPVHLVPASAGHLLLPVGEKEGDEYHRQTESLAAAWRRRGLRVDVMDMAGHDHFSIITELGAPGAPLSRAILRQIGVPEPAVGTGAR
jgi:arylformamidase